RGRARTARAHSGTPCRIRSVLRLPRLVLFGFQAPRAHSRPCDPLPHLGIRRDFDFGGRRGEPRPRENRVVANTPAKAVQHEPRPRNGRRFALPLATFRTPWWRGRTRIRRAGFLVLTRPIWA